jgi:hypothetical protein
MLVDPDLLRAFAGQVDMAASTIHEADVDNEVSAAGDGLPGSTTAWAARLIGGHVTRQADAITANAAKMGEAVRGAGNTYEVTDSDLAGSFKGIF